KILKPLILLVIFYFCMFVPSHSIYKGLKVPQGTGRIFFRFATENLHPFRVATSLPNFFRLEFGYHQADTSKSNYLGSSAWIAIIRAEPLVLSLNNFTYHIVRYVICGGSSPHDEPASTPKAKEHLFKPTYLPV
ncbi:hypothetical protein IKE_06456, partial [Bacillus cereus VD196]